MQYILFPQGWLTNAHHDRQVYSIVLVGLFLITELIPFFTGLDHDLLSLIAIDSRASDHGPDGVSVYTSANYGSLPTNGHTPSSDASSLEGGIGGGPAAIGHGRGSAFQRASYGSEDGVIDHGNGE